MGHILAVLKDYIFEDPLHFLEENYATASVTKAQAKECLKNAWTLYYKLNIQNVFEDLHQLKKMKKKEKKRKRKARRKRKAAVAEGAENKQQQ